MRILILGGGFGGIYAALHLEKAFAREGNVEVTLINRDNYLLFSPMLAEVSSSSIEANHIVPPIRAFFRKVRFRDSQIRAFHCQQCPHYSLEFDHLVLALGSGSSFHGLPGVEGTALSFKALADAMALRNQVIDRLEHADLETDVELRGQLLTVVVAGAGFAGVEVAAELNDFLRRAKRFYPNIRPEEVRLVLVAPGTRILPGLAEDLAAYAHKVYSKLSRGKREKLEGVETVGWLDRFGILRTAVDRALLQEESAVLEGVFVLISEGTPA